MQGSTEDVHNTYNKKDRPHTDMITRLKQTHELLLFNEVPVQNFLQ